MLEQIFSYRFFYTIFYLSSRELGKQAVEEKQRQRELHEKGYALRQQYAAQGKIIKENNKVVYLAFYFLSLLG